MLMVPLGGLALTGGYLHGRREVVGNALAQREHAIQERERESLEGERQEREQREREQLSQDRDAPGVPQSPECEAVGLNSSSPHTVGVTSPNGGSIHPNVSADPPSAPSTDPQERLRAAITAIYKAHAAEKNYKQAKEDMEEELAPFEEELKNLQLRPIFPDLPPHPKERLNTLYGQWLKEFDALLDTVAEAFRNCKDGDQVAQLIAEYKTTLKQ